MNAVVGYPPGSGNNVGNVSVNQDNSGFRLWGDNNITIQIGAEVLRSRGLPLTKANMTTAILGVQQNPEAFVEASPTLRSQVYQEQGSFPTGSQPPNAAQAPGMQPSPPDQLQSLGMESAPQDIPDVSNPPAAGGQTSDFDPSLSTWASQAAIGAAAAAAIYAAFKRANPNATPAQMMQTISPEQAAGLAQRVNAGQDISGELMPRNQSMTVANQRPGIEVDPLEGEFSRVGGSNEAARSPSTSQVTSEAQTRALPPIEPLESTPINDPLSNDGVTTRGQRKQRASAPPAGNPALSPPATNVQTGDMNTGRGASTSDSAPASGANASGQHTGNQGSEPQGGTRGYNANGGEVVGGNKTEMEIIGQIDNMDRETAASQYGESRTPTDPRDTTGRKATIDATNARGEPTAIANQRVDADFTDPNSGTKVYRTTNGNTERFYLVDGTEVRFPVRGEDGTPDWNYAHRDSKLSQLLKRYGRAAATAIRGAF